jgi:hypothetical protein
MAVTMQRNRCPANLKCAHSSPEPWVRLATVQIAVSVFRNDGQDRPDSELIDDRQKALPAAEINSRAEIVETKKVLSWIWYQVAPSDLGILRTSLSFERARP